MRGWLILAGVLLLLWLLSLIRIGGRVRYDREGLYVAAVFGPVKMKLFPREKKPKKSRRQTEKHPQEPKAKLTFGQKKEKVRNMLDLVLRFLPPVTDAAGRLRRKIRVDRLEMQMLCAGADDPAQAAIRYGQANAALGAVWPMIDSAFRVKDRDLRVGVDFKAEETEISLSAQLTIAIGQIAALGFILACRTLKILIQYRRNRKKEDGTHGKQSSHQ